MAYPGVRGLLDVALVAVKYAVDWAAVVARARAWRVATATGLVLALTAELFGLQDVRAAGEALRPSALRQRLLSLFTGPQAVLAGQDITRSRRRFLYQLALVDRPQDMAGLVWRALWPEDTWLTARYGAATLDIRARHALMAVRGRV